MSEIGLMQWMNVDQLDRYADAMQAIEEEEACLSQKCSLLRNSLVLSGAKVAVLGRKHSGPHQKCISNSQDISNSIHAQFSAFHKLAGWACEAMEKLVEDGTTPAKCGGSEKFYALIYQQILQTRIMEIKADVDFKQVRIMEFLKHVLVNRLDEFAADHREKGNPVLAQVMEQLAEEARRNWKGN